MLGFSIFIEFTAVNHWMVERAATHHYIWYAAARPLILMVKIGTATVGGERNTS